MELDSWSPNAGNGNFGGKQIFKTSAGRGHFVRRQWLANNHELITPYVARDFTPNLGVVDEDEELISPFHYRNTMGNADDPYADDMVCFV